MAALAGLLAPMLNYALAFGDRFLNEAIRQHAAPSDATYALWPVVLAGGALTNLAYVLYLAKVNHTLGQLQTDLARHSVRRDDGGPLDGIDGNLWNRYHILRISRCVSGSEHLSDQHHPDGKY